MIDKQLEKEAQNLFSLFHICMRYMDTMLDNKYFVKEEKQRANNLMAFLTKRCDTYWNTIKNNVDNEELTIYSNLIEDFESIIVSMRTMSPFEVKCVYETAKVIPSYITTEKTIIDINEIVKTHVHPQAVVSLSQLLAKSSKKDIDVLVINVNGINCKISSTHGNVIVFEYDTSEGKRNFAYTINNLDTETLCSINNFLYTRLQISEKTKLPSLESATEHTTVQ